MTEKKIVLVIAYDGTYFHGSQFQEGLRTVQGELEQAIDKVFGLTSRLELASRTDSGVHAEGQVATFLTNNDMENISNITGAINAYIGEDIRIVYANEITNNYKMFNPRIDARSRKYVYTFTDSEVLLPRYRNYVQHVKGSLDDQLMNCAASFLIGSHDFKAFAGPSVKKGNSTRRIVSESFVVRDSNFVIFTIVANAFLHQQIRRISSLLMQIGLGKKTPEDVKYYLASKIRGEFVQVSKAKGLCLKTVKYSHNWSSIFRTHPSLLDSKI